MIYDKLGGEKHANDLVNSWAFLKSMEGIQGEDFSFWGEQTPELLISEKWSPPTQSSGPPRRRLGVPLPAGWPGEVTGLQILHPSHCTPDLPGRVGFDVKDLRRYKELLVDQGDQGTCTSCAVAMGLGIAAARARQRPRLEVKFSPAWLHCASADDGDLWTTGRCLDQVVRVITSALPCSEESFPYDAGEREFRQYRTAMRTSNCEDLVGRLGKPWVSKINSGDISGIKTMLAAGWVVVVTTSFPKTLWGPGLNDYGSPAQSLPGDRREPNGHAWLLVGYDHVDSSEAWSYQGRFWCLNSWGDEWPKQAPWGPGLCSLPFSFLLSEGIDAVALRFPARS